MCQVNTNPMKSQVRKDYPLQWRGYDKGAKEEGKEREGARGMDGRRGGKGKENGEENGRGSRESFYPRSGSDFYCTRCFRVEGIRFKAKSVLRCLELAFSTGQIMGRNYVPKFSRVSLYTGCLRIYRTCFTRVLWIYYWIPCISTTIVCDSIHLDLGIKRVIPNEKKKKRILYLYFKIPNIDTFYYHLVKLHDTKFVVFLINK